MMGLKYLGFTLDGTPIGVQGAFQLPDLQIGRPIY